MSVNHLGFLYQAQGRYGEAEPLFKWALTGREKALGPEHPDTLLSVNNLAALYDTQGRYGEAAPLYQRALSGYEKALGPEHPDTLTSVNNLAVLYFAQRDWLGAAQLWRRGTAAIGRRVQRGEQGAELTGKKASEAQQSDWQFWGLVKVAYRLALDGRMPEIAAASEMFHTAQWALSSEAAQSLAQMAARGATGDAALAPLVRERQDLADEWQGREKLQAAALGQDAATRNAKAEAENRERMAAIDRRIPEIDSRLKAEFPDYFARANPGPTSVEDVQVQLGADEALVLFLDTPEWQPTPEVLHHGFSVFDDKMRIIMSNRLSRETFAEYYTAMEKGSSGREAMLSCVRRAMPLVSDEECRRTVGKIEAHIYSGKPIELVTDSGIYRTTCHKLSHDRYLAVSVDIAEERKRKKEIATARRQANAPDQGNSTFLADMRHEMRTPLNSLLGMAYVLMQRPLTPPQMEQAGAILGSGKSLKTLFDDLLDLSKMEA